MEQLDPNITKYSKRPLTGLSGMCSYYTIWSCKPVDKDDPRGLFLDEFPDACFSRGQGAYHKLHSPHKHTLRVLTIPEDEETDPRLRNLTLLSPDQIVEMLMLCNQMEEGLISDVSIEENIPFTRYRGDTQNSHLLSFTINTDINLLQRFILTWMRYAWETPYNLAISEAFKLREHIDDESLTLFDWYLVCINALTFQERISGYNVGHAITFIRSQIAHFTSPSDLYSSILKYHTESQSRLRVNDVYKYSVFKSSRDLKPIPKNFLTDNEFTWKDVGMFNKRLPYYLKWYEYIKSLA